MEAVQGEPSFGLRGGTELDARASGNEPHHVALPARPDEEEPRLSGAERSFRARRTGQPVALAQRSGAGV
ncbi:hypothetical protein [Sorangium sp. So ce1078]|uniref:hypothetical protein n=1 Tax=Sorangium sp. So ce1078 TaxID=3133329 RepID=UPI003F60D245